MINLSSRVNQKALHPHSYQIQLRFNAFRDSEDRQIEAAFIIFIYQAAVGKNTT